MLSLNPSKNSVKKTFIFSRNYFMQDKTHTKRGQFQGDVLQSIASLIHNQHIENDIVLVDINVSFSVNRIRESRKLCNLEEEYEAGRQKNNCDSTTMMN